MPTKITLTRVYRILGEHTAKKLRKEGKLKPVGTGFGGTNMFYLEDVRKVEKELREL